MRKLRTFALATVAVQVGLGLIAAAPAYATPSCTFTGGALTITDDTATGADRIDVWQDSNDQVWASTGPVLTPASPGSFCSAGQVPAASVTSISVTGGTANNTLVVWLTQTPAATIPSPPSPLGGPAADWGSIAWTVDLGSSQGDVLAITAPQEAQGVTITAGDSGVNLNDDAQVDISYSGIVGLEVVVAAAGPARNVVSLAGDSVTGGPVTIGGLIIILGRPSNDTITGGAGFDFLKAGPGNDKILGGDGNDRVRGGGGNDKILGGDGNDKVFGDAGRDVCSGGPGKDRVVCEVSRARI